MRESGEGVSDATPAHSTFQPTSNLSLLLAVAIPSAIDDLFQHYGNAPGIPAWLVAEALEYGSILSERGDRLLFASKRKGETAEMFVGLVRSLTILSFVPGGVPFGEEHYDAEKQLVARYGEDGRVFCQKSLHLYLNARVTDIPVACWSEGPTPTAFGTYNAVRWFEQASGEDLRQLRADRYRGRAVCGPDQLSGGGYAQRLLSQVYVKARDRVRWSVPVEDEVAPLEALGDRLFLAACDGMQEIAFQVEPDAAEAWLDLFRHAWLSGERSLLLPE
jgi:hypothetical protein